MKAPVRNPCRQDDTSLGLFAAVVLFAGLAMAATFDTSVAAGKNGASKQSQARAVALTAQDQIDRNQQVGTFHTSRAPTKAYNDKTCSGAHRPHSCFPHSH